MSRWSVSLTALSALVGVGALLNYFVYPYAEADGTPVTDLPTTFHFERLPLAPREL